MSLTEMILKRFVVSILVLLISLCLKGVALGDCDCGSTDTLIPCTGNSIVEKVHVTIPDKKGTERQVIFSWKFNSGGKDARCGQFANMDYWVAPAPGENNVTFTEITGNGEISADINPVMEALGILPGSKTYGNFDASENVVASLPFTSSGAVSLVAAAKRDEQANGNCGTPSIVGGCVDAYNVVTVLDHVPENGGSDMIRPNITGQKKSFLRLQDFDLKRLPKKNFLTGTDSKGFEEIRQRWSHSTEIFSLVNSSGKAFSEGGRAFRAHAINDDYASGVAAAWANDMMVIFSDANSLTQKKEAIAAMLSYGLDIYSAMYESEEKRHWGTGAGQHAGKFLPAVFMAALARDRTYGDKLMQVSGQIRETYFSGPAELAQVNAGVYGSIYGDTSKFKGKYNHGAYWASLLVSQCYDGAQGTCTTSAGQKAQADPYGFIDGPPNKPGSGYMGVSLGVQRSFVAAMILMPEIARIVNYDDLVDYVRRVDTYGLKTKDDPCVTPDSREDYRTCDAYRNIRCRYYGKTWGPVNPDDIHSSCITEPTPPYTKVGRFTQLDGVKIKKVYTSRQVEKNWGLILENLQLTLKKLKSDR